MGKNKDGSIEIEEHTLNDKNCPDRRSAGQDWVKDEGCRMKGEEGRFERVEERVKYSRYLVGNKLAIFPVL